MIDPAFRSAAAEAGLLHELDGWRYIADECVDEASGQKQCLIEYGDPRLLTDDRAMATLLARLREQHPAARSVLVRVPDDAELAAPWTRYLTYVRRNGTAESMARSESVVPAGEEHRAALREWLVRALRAGCAEQDRPVVTESLYATADVVLDRADRLSYVYVQDGWAVGHVTLLDDARDDLTGRAYVELFDTLVEPVGNRSHVAACLVAAAVDHAAGRCLPLIGHVVHPTGEDGTRHGAGVLHTLLGSGWAVDHTYWTRSLGEGTPS